MEVLLKESRGEEVEEVVDLNCWRLHRRGSIKVFEVSTLVSLDPELQGNTVGC